MEGGEHEQLAAENKVLRERVAALEEQLNFLGQHRMLSAGIKGERLIARIVGGELTPHTTGHDIETGSANIEVKYAKLSRPVRTAPTLRWQWQKIFGQTGGKNYSHLVLIGEADSRYRSGYRDPLSPYVFFLIPFEEALPLCVKGNPLGINVVSNPHAQGRTKILFEKYQVTANEIEERFKLKYSD